MALLKNSIGTEQQRGAGAEVPQEASVDSDNIDEGVKHRQCKHWQQEIQDSITLLKLSYFTQTILC